LTTRKADNTTAKVKVVEATISAGVEEDKDPRIDLQNSTVSHLAT
jgi:hypothetical protein